MEVILWINTFKIYVILKVRSNNILVSFFHGNFVEGWGVFEIKVIKF